MTEAPAHGAFDSDEPFQPFEEMEREFEASPAETSPGRREASSIAERLRALEAFSPA